MQADLPAVLIVLVVISVFILIPFRYQRRFPRVFSIQLFGVRGVPTISGAGQIQSMGDLNLHIGKTDEELLIFEGLFFVKRIRLPFREISTSIEGFWPFEQVLIKNNLEPDLYVKITLDFGRRVVKFTNGKFSLPEEIK